MKSAALILAAGASSRLGQPKALLRHGSKSFLRIAVEAATGARCAPVVVVTGAAAERLAPELEGLPVSTVHHAGWAEGIGSSIAAGIAVLCAEKPAVEAVVLMVCDQPLVTAATIEGLVEAQACSGKSIAASAYEFTLGVPALFTRRWFDALAGLTGDTGAKKIVAANLSEVASCPFPEGACDIDTAADLQRLNESPSLRAFQDL